MSPTPTTREGYEKIKSELDRLEQHEMPRITQLLAEARAEGDLKENAEYHAQRENQGMLQAKINLLKSKLADAYIVDTDNLPKDQIAFGSKVKLKDLDADLEETYELVGPGEEDYSGEVMKILCESPLAKQLLNHKPGDKVTVETPGGAINYEVLSIA
ncbi:Transcription elongation factor GreA [Planctomycetes bacterium Pan216]|uniref:Transcription elongation factor GreA n=1 Tax=Kolteria novifilia TaxID=2527975 RepID=A0A518BC03_9BACT|nr:Transcription elongation factor GreA [Planctomycetes bacterium Pan216]